MSIDQEYKLAIRLSGLRYAIRENSSNHSLCARLQRDAAKVQRELRRA